MDQPCQKFQHRLLPEVGDLNNPVWTFLPTVPGLDAISRRPLLQLFVEFIVFGRNNGADFETKEVEPSVVTLEGTCPKWKRLVIGFDTTVSCIATSSATTTHSDSVASSCQPLWLGSHEASSWHFLQSMSNSLETRRCPFQGCAGADP